MKRDNRQVLPSRTVEILTTQKCNLNCTYCFEVCKSGKSVAFKDFLEKVQKRDGAPLICEDIFIFGGEPLLNVDFISEAIEYIGSQDLPQEVKDRYISSITQDLITNGTLIDRHLELIKKYNISLQISLDGPEDINDRHRVDFSGHGHYSHIMDNIRLCKEHGIKYTIHGALSKENYKELPRIVEWVLKMQRENPDCDIQELENCLRMNFAQIVIEEERTDRDIDTFLKALYESVRLILKTPVLAEYSDETRKKIAVGLLRHQGGICAAGVTLFAYDQDFNMYPCHRAATNASRKSLNDDPALGILYQKVAERKVMYGARFNLDGRDPYAYYANWCPATNKETTGDVFYLPPHDNVMVAELQRFIPLLADHFDLDLDM